MKKEIFGQPPKTPSGADNEPALQTIWSGTISFSLVAIPVHLVKAIEPGRVSFHMLHKKDFSPLLRKMFCPVEERIVPPQEIVRGYETEPDRYVVITDEELESLSPERSRTIEIIQFVDTGEVDFVYYDHPYYLIPARGGEKAYGLLSEIMKGSKRAGIARFVLGEREYLVAVRSTGQALSLITLHYGNEILPVNFAAPDETTGDNEAKKEMEKIISSMIRDFNPDKYADHRNKEIMKLLWKKAKVSGSVEAPVIAEGTEAGPADLVALLEESMRKVKQGK